MNMYSFVDNPFTERAEFNWKKLEEMTHLAVDLLDDIVDLELEKVQGIIDKIKSDPEDESVKRTELELWEKIYEAGKNGRRLGLGTTADGDMVAAMGLTYGTQEANDFLTKVHKFIGVNSYMESIILAEERGAFALSLTAVEDCHNQEGRKSRNNRKDVSCRSMFFFNLLQLWQLILNIS